MEHVYDTGVPGLSAKILFRTTSSMNSLTSRTTRNMNGKEQLWPRKQTQELRRMGSAKRYWIHVME